MTAVETKPEARTTVTLPLVSLKDMTELFPSVTPGSIYRWRTRDNLPPPSLTLGKKPLWDEDTLIEWAAARKLTVDKRALTRIRKRQMNQL